MEKRLTVKVTVERDLHQARVARKVDTAIHRLNHYPVDSAVYFGNTYPLDTGLSGASRCL